MKQEVIQGEFTHRAIPPSVSVSDNRNVPNKQLTLRIANPIQPINIGDMQSNNNNNNNNSITHVCAEEARVHQRADDEDGGEDQNDGGSRKRFHEWIFQLTKMPRSVILLTQHNPNVVISHALLLATIC